MYFESPFPLYNILASEAMLNFFIVIIILNS